MRISSVGWIMGWILLFSCVSVKFGPLFAFTFAGIGCIILSKWID